MSLTWRAAPLVIAILYSSSVEAQTIAALSGDSSWRDHDRAGFAARQRGDWPAALHHALALDSMLYGIPRVTLAIARAHANLRDTAAAVAALSRYATMGLGYDVAADSQLTWLEPIAAFVPVARRLRSNRAARTPLEIAATMPEEDFVAEGVAYDARRQRLLVSSIRYGKVVAVATDGVTRDFIDLKKDGAWGGMGMAIDSARDRLWVTSRWYSATLGASPADSGRSVVLRYQLGSGKLEARYDLPRGAHEPGDLCLAGNGDVFVSDGRAGTIFVVRDTLALLLPAGPLISPQGCAVDERGPDRRLLVADYALGIAAVNIVTGDVSWLPRSRFVAVTGVDGMLLDGDRLIGVQNGVEPNRVIAMHLDHDHRSISSVEVIAQDTSRMHEPTHVTMMGRKVVFVGNGGFGAFDLASGLRKPGSRLHAASLLVIPHSRAIGTDTTSAKAELVAFDRRLAREAADSRDPVALLDHASSDAPILLPHHPILRAGSARSVLKERYGAPASYAWKPAHAVVGADGLFGCTIGASTYSVAADSAKRAGSYLTCWARQTSSEPWRIVGHQRSDSQGQSSAADARSRVFPASLAQHTSIADAEGALAADEAFARRSSLPDGPGPAFAAYIAPDGILVLPPNYPAGPEGMRSLFMEYPKSRVLLWHPERALGGGSGGLAFTVGYSLTRDRGDSPGAQVAGKYFTVWRQSASGRWEFVLDQGTPGR